MILHFPALLPFPLLYYLRQIILTDVPPTWNPFNPRLNAVPTLHYLALLYWTLLYLALHYLALLWVTSIPYLNSVHLSSALYKHECCSALLCLSSFWSPLSSNPLFIPFTCLSPSISSPVSPLWSASGRASTPGPLKKICRCVRYALVHYNTTHCVMVSYAMIFALCNAVYCAKPIPSLA